VGARTYDPRTARWLQRDPIDAASGDPNLYRYCGNDPINRVDIDGSNSEEKHPNNSAGKKAKDKTRQKVAFVCVGDTDYSGTRSLRVRKSAKELPREGNDLTEAKF